MSKMNFGNLYCSTIVRGASDQELTGYFYHLDWDGKKIIRKVPVPASKKQFGARGGSRGGRGLLVHDGHLYATTCDKVIVYDRTWKIADIFEHPHIIGHHDLALDRDGFWCTSTMIDALFKLDWQGHIIDNWYASEDHNFIDRFKDDDAGIHMVRRPRARDYVSEVVQEAADVFDEQFHFNTVDIHNGCLYAFSNRKYALVQVHPEIKIIQRTPRWLWAHNVLLKHGDIIVNNSNHRRFEIYTMGSHTPRVSILLDITEGIATQFSTSGWVRGIAIYNDRYLFVGSSPSVIFLIDVQQERIVDQMVLSDQVNDTVHSLALDPQTTIVG